MYGLAVQLIFVLMFLVLQWHGEWYCCPQRQTAIASPVLPSPLHPSLAHTRHSIPSQAERT